MKKIMDKVLFIGGNSCLAKSVAPILDKKYEVILKSSRDCDVRDYKSLEGNIELINHVVYFPVVNHDDLIKNVKEENIKKSIEVSILGLINTLKICSLNKVKSFTFISSILSDKIIRGASIYGSSKAFGEKLVEYYVQENRNSRANILQLGYFESGLSDKLPENIKTNALNSIPQNRFGKKEELANAIDFCISNEYLNGAKIKISGGL